MEKPKIEYLGRTFIFISPWADGDYYESECGQFFLLTDAEGKVDFHSQESLEVR